MCEHGLKTYYVVIMNNINNGFSVGRGLFEARDDFELVKKLDELYEKENKVCIFFKELKGDKYDKK